MRGTSITRHKSYAEQEKRAKADAAQALVLINQMEANAEEKKHRKAHDDAAQARALMNEMRIGAENDKQKKLREDAVAALMKQREK